MTLQTITDNSAVFTDESFDDEDLISLANKGISRINNECGTLFPYYKGMNDSYNAFPDNWQLDLVSNYVSYGIKMNDSSLTEANMYLDEFYKVLSSFKDKLGTLVENYENGNESNGISPDYIDQTGFGGIFGIDTSGAVNIGFFGSNSNGGSF